MKIETHKVIDGKPVSLIKEFKTRNMSFYSIIGLDEWKESFYICSGDKVLFKVSLSASSGETACPYIDDIEEIYS